MRRSVPSTMLMVVCFRVEQAAEPDSRDRKDLRVLTSAILHPGRDSTRTDSNLTLAIFSVTFSAGSANVCVEDGISPLISSFHFPNRFSVLTDECSSTRPLLAISAREAGRSREPRWKP